MSTVEALHSSALEDAEQLRTPDNWPEGVPRNGMELSQKFDQIRGPHFDKRMALMQQDGPEIVEILEIEFRLSSLTYSARPFTDLRVAKGIAEDLQRLSDLYDMGTVVGHVNRGIAHKMHGWTERTPAVQRDAE
ncbi:MAG: hypothetical protein PHX87_00735 [Candidatus Peribacteraceae bacterium]|nr:hypothetical protein [Candidatus Peribacteraceae bacterium]MDD5741934.1 hypothetical protein [Candidatus Peribacteraceae bacterium]